VILLNTRRRVWRRTADVLAVAYRYAAHRRDLLTRKGSCPRTGGVLVEPIRNAAGHIVVPAGYAQGRADLQLTHHPEQP
jgi:acetylornithine/succinyldiaminopimelate/putrescine aminotransferase